MLTPYYARLMTAQTAGSAFTSTTAGSILPTPAVYTFPASFLQFIGQEFRIRASGTITTTTGSNTVTFNLELGGSVNAWGSGAITLVASQTNETWILDTTFTVRAVGSGTSANLMGVGMFNASVALVANGGVLCPATAPAVGTGFNSTASQTVDLWAAFNNTGNSLTLQQFSLDACL